MANESVDIKVRLQEARKAAADADRVGKSLKGMGRDAERSGKRSEGASRGFGMVNTRMRVMKGVSVGAGAGLRGLGVAAAGVGVAGIGAYKGLKFATVSAVNLGEQISKNKVVFKDGAAAVLSFSDSAATGLAISKRQALEAAGTFGNMLVPMGIARDRAGDMSTRMVALAADMASFNNASPEETLDALRAGLSGETEPLRRFGVRLSAARVEEEALRMGLAKSKDGLTDAMKAQAAYAIILKDSKDQHGDVGRTMGSLANRQRQLKAQWEDLGAVLGASTVPELEKAAGAASDFLASTNKIAASDRSTDEKAKAIGAAARREFQPLARELAGAMNEAEIGDHIAASIERAAPEIMEAMGHGAVKAADGFVQAFLDSGPYGKMFALALVGSKLGAFSTAGKWAGGRFGRRAATESATSLATGFGPALHQRQTHFQGPKTRGMFTNLGRGFGALTGIGFAIAFEPIAREALREAGKFLNGEGKGTVGRIGEAFGKTPYGDLIKQGAGAYEAIRGNGRRPSPRPGLRRSTNNPRAGAPAGKRWSPKPSGGPSGNGTLGRAAMMPRPDSGRRMRLEADQPVVVKIGERAVAEANAKVRVRSAERGG